LQAFTQDRTPPLVAAIFLRGYIDRWAAEPRLAELLSQLHL